MVSSRLTVNQRGHSTINNIHIHTLGDDMELSKICFYIIIVIFLIKNKKVHHANAVPLSPCPQIFHYEYDGRNWIAVAKIPSRIYNQYRNQKMAVTVMLEMPGYSQYLTMGGIDLMHSMDHTMLDIIKNRPIAYRITFPEQRISPALRQIVVNHKILCANNDRMLGQKYQLKYTLLLRGRHERKSSSAAINPLSRGYETPFVAKNTMRRQQNEAVCGHIDSQIGINGFSNDADSIAKGQWPWLVAIYHKKPESIYLQCTGNLISNKLVLTAAHCFWSHMPRHADEILLIFGRHNLRNWTEENAIITDAASIYMHPDYMQRGQRFDADIAIVRPKNYIEYNTWIRPICFWPHSHLAPSMEMATFVGWPPVDDLITKIPRRLNMQMVTRRQCIQSRNAFQYVTAERTFCAGSKNGRVPCKSDSGGGLAVLRNGRWFLSGIFSLALFDPILNSCDLNDYVVVTDVSKFTPWIHRFL